MRLNPVPLIAALLLSISCFAQDGQFRISLKSGSFIPKKNITDSIVAKVQTTGKGASQQPSFLIIQFEKLPGDRERAQLSREGIHLLEYVPNNAYSAYVSRAVNAATLLSLNARAIIAVEPFQKVDQQLLLAGSLKNRNDQELWIHVVPQVSFSNLAATLQQNNISISKTDYREYGVLGVQVPAGKLLELAGLPFVTWVEPAPGKMKPLLNRSRPNSRINVLSSSLPGGRNLRGEGIVMGIGDFANPFQHVDYNARVINRSPLSGFGPEEFHGHIVMGIAGGAGNIAEKFTGYATKAAMILQVESNILAYAGNYVQDYGMVLTNNSYGDPGSGCSSFGNYNLYARIVDQQAFQYNNLLHVFAAGNSGGTICYPNPTGFRTVYGGFQTAKNIITVGSTTYTGSIANGSSKGPVKDGRVKPEIVAQGDQVASSYPIYLNPYIYEYGTSLSAPAVTGTLAILYQRYRQLHGNANPENGLMKAILCNGATDLGKTGPDFTFGYGWTNALRSVRAIEANSYFTGSVNAAGTNIHSITVPAGLAQMKVMLYWNDSASSVYTGANLVNDLDLEVVDPSSTVNLPYVLDTLTSKLDSSAQPGVDHVNNIEQVVINNPAAGTYNFRIKGTTIPLAAQHSYYLVYDTIPVYTELTFPIGGERFTNAEQVLISWDSYGNPANNYTLDYSIDNGVTWINIATVAANLRQYQWVTPGVNSEQVRVRLTHNGTPFQQTSSPFIIITGFPVLSLASVQCEGFINLNWTAVAGITDYEVMILKDDEMKSVATTTATNYVYGGLSRDSIYWVTVRPRLNGVPGQRANAISRQPSTGTCAGLISDNDIKLESIIAPNSGRRLTSTELTAAQTVTIRLKNLDDATTIGDIPVSFKLGANPTVNETIIAPNIAAGAFFNYTFTTTIDLSATGTYPFSAYVSYPADIVHQNDTLASIVKQIDNPFIDITTPFLDNLETATTFEVLKSKIGLDGVDRYDFVGTSPYSRIRSIINSGMAYSGSKTLVLDAERFVGAGVSDSLKGTFNLTGYNPSLQDIRLDFQFRQHGQEPNPANNVWIRGSDLDPWISVYNLYANQAEPGIYKRSSSIELSDLLLANSQTFTSSFQARWGQWGQILASDEFYGAGYSFDDIRLYTVTDDIQMIRVDTPTVSSCGLTAAEPLRVIVRNSANSMINNIPVSFRVDNGAIVNEVIPSIAGNDSVEYTFTATADLSTAGLHIVRTWVSYPTDSFRDNDTTQTTIRNSPLISTFPYLENFEAGEAFWYSDGKNNSWAFGTPSATKINAAASGTKAWKTSLNGNYRNYEKSYLYSPCFNTVGMTNPTLSMSMALDLEDCGGTLCDAAYAEYSSDGINWLRLGTAVAGTNWYNRNFPGNPVWSIQDFTRWHVATTALPTGISQLRIRIVLESDPAVNLEGVAIDDIHIYDNTNGIYEMPPSTSAVVTQASVTGSAWIDFITGGKLLASINPNGQNLGSTDVQTYINTGAVRTSTNNQYYHNRNITIKPTNIALSDSALVRFYFLETETVALVNATGCPTCTKPTSAYELGVSKYSDIVDANENGSLGDDITGNWLYLLPANVIKVPFDKGYYAEFKVKDFSEFWLNNGGVRRDEALPVKLTDFSAKRQREDVLVEWKVEMEENIAYYDVEMARGSDALRQNQFVMIGRIASTGNAVGSKTYQYLDEELNKTGSRYYRLKIIGKDGTISYSAIKPVIFDTDIKWLVYPNPSSGIFNFVYQVNTGEQLKARIHDVNGKLVKSITITGNGFVQKQQFDLRSASYGAGMYLLEVYAGDRKQVFRMLKK